MELVVISIISIIISGILTYIIDDILLSKSKFDYLGRTIASGIICALIYIILVIILIIYI